jgi:transposase InsO family protein
LQDRRLSITIRVDQGSEFVSRGLDLWAYQKGVILDFSRVAKLEQLGLVKRYTGEADRRVSEATITQKARP